MYFNIYEKPNNRWTHTFIYTFIVFLQNWIILCNRPYYLQNFKIFTKKVLQVRGDKWMIYLKNISDCLSFLSFVFMSVTPVLFPHLWHFLFLFYSCVIVYFPTAAAGLKPIIPNKNNLCFHQTVQITFLLDWTAL